MKRTAWAVLMILCFLLCGCDGSAELENSVAEARQRWAEAESIGFTADVVTELEDSVFECVLRCTVSEEEYLVELISPENIAGIKARLRKDESTLEYDGLILALEDSVIGECSPLKGSAMLTKAILEGHIRSIWTETDGERELIAGEIYISENEYAGIWLDKEKLDPCYMELVSGGRAVVKCRIDSFTEE